MRNVYDYKKRMALKEKLKQIAHKITMLKDNRKMKHNRKFPDWERPAGVWLDQQQYEFRHRHIAASIMRKKLLHEIETLPRGWKWVDGTATRIGLTHNYYDMPDMKYIKSILTDHIEEGPFKERYLNENVCIGSENPLQESTGGASGSRFG